MHRLVTTVIQGKCDCIVGGQYMDLLPGEHRWGLPATECLEVGDLSLEHLGDLLVTTGQGARAGMVRPQGRTLHQRHSFGHPVSGEAL